MKNTSQRFSKKMLELLLHGACDDVFPDIQANGIIRGTIKIRLEGKTKVRILLCSTDGKTTYVVWGPFNTKEIHEINLEGIEFYLPMHLR